VLPEIDELRGERGAGVDRESRRTLAIQGGRLLLEAVGRDGVLLAVDDLQWADATSLHLLAILSARSQMIRLVLAFRSDEAREPALASFLDDLRRTGAVTDLELGPLPVEAVERLTGVRWSRAIASGRPRPARGREVVRLLEGAARRG
jgi:predicted ATPase